MEFVLVRALLPPPAAQTQVVRVLPTTAMPSLDPAGTAGAAWGRLGGSWRAAVHCWRRHRGRHAASSASPVP